LKVDYIIVGFGLAGMSFCEQLRRNNKTFLVIDQQKESSSLVAGGMYNPVILKRFTLPWNSVEQLNFAMPFYDKLFGFLGNDYLRPYPLNRIFSSIEEQNTWLVAADKPGLNTFLDTEFTNLSNDFIKNPYKVGQVKSAGRLLIKDLLDNYKGLLLKDNLFLEDSFNYEKLELDSEFIKYKEVSATNIVFAEGYGVKSNPFFNHLPLMGTKGETITIHAPELKLNSIVKSGVFIIPQEEKDYYLIGATYNWEDKSWKATEKGKQELLNKVRAFLKCDFTVVGQTAGIRPTVKDRRPLVGCHHEYKNMYILNGLGTRGVMVAPLLSSQLYNFIEKGIDLDDEVNITRFY